MDRTTALLYVGAAMVFLLVLQYVLKAVTQPTPVIVVERPYRRGWGWYGGGLPGWGPRNYIPPAHPIHPPSAPPPAAPAPPPAAPAPPPAAPAEPSQPATPAA